MYGFKPGAKPEEKAPKGKKIVGPGTGTSDSIPAKIPKGSYIMPADSTQQIGPKALGELGQPVPVNVSNGEYQMPPEQVHAIGVQVLEGMKAATHEPAEEAAEKYEQEGPEGEDQSRPDLYFADGGLIPSQDDTANIVQQVTGGYGLRRDGSPKGDGYFGPLATSDGSTMTEFSGEADVDGKRIHFPLVTPNQSFKDLSNVLTGGRPTGDMYDKAIEHAQSRILTGRSPFATSGEQRGFQVLNPAPAGFKPQNDGLYFADGGLIADAAQYWANDNEQFEAGNPSFGSRVVRALNPATSFGSAMGAMHTAAGSGDKTGMALAAAQAVPVFGAMRSVITPAMGAVKAARAMAPSAAQTGAAIAGSGVAGAMADAYGSPAVAAEPQQSSAAFSDMQREPNIPRREEPRLGFADGGSPAEEDWRRQAMQGGPFGVSYSGMTGQPQPIANPLPQPRSQPAAGMRSVAYGDLQRAPNIPQPSMPAPTRRIDSAPAPQPSAQGTPRAEQAPQQPAQQEAATTQEQQPSPTTFSSLQREPNIPRTGQPRQMPQGEPIGTSGVVGGFRAAGQRAAAGVQSAADQVAQAGRDFVAGGQAMTDQAATASGALNYLNRGDPVRDAIGAVGGVFSRSAQQARKADYGATGAPSPAAPAPEQSTPPPVAQPAPAATTPAADQPASPGATPPVPAARTGYGFTPDPMQGPAPGMSVRPTSAEGINRIDNAPGLKSPLFTNLPAGQAVSEMQGGTVNTVPAAAMMAAGPATSRATSAALQAAAARGDWDAVRGFYQQNGGTWQGRTAQQDADERQATAGGAIGNGRYGFRFTRRSEDRAADRAVAERRARTEESIARERLGIERGRADTEATTKGFEARGLERMEKLYAAYENAKTPEERAAAVEQIRVMNGREAPNRFTVVPGGQEFDSAAGTAVTRPSRVFNNQTGQFVDQQQGSQAASAAPRAGEVRGGYRFKGGNPADQASWEKV